MARTQASQSERGRLVQALLDEMGGWRGRDQLDAFEGWLRRSISLTHLVVLAILDARGPTSVGGLAELLGISVASATGIVSRLEARGLVVRTRGASGDHRVVLVVPTEQGRRIFDELEAQRRLHLERLIAEMSAADVTVLLRAVRVMGDARQRLRGRDGPPSTGSDAARPADTAVAPSER